MGFRFHRTIGLGKGLRVNLGKRGASFTVGGRGAGVTFGGRGTNLHVGIPGTGLSWDERVGGRRREAGRAGRGWSRAIGAVVAVGLLAWFFGVFGHH